MAFHDEQTYPCNRAGVPGVYQGYLIAAAEAHDKPGVLGLEYVTAAGSESRRYIWCDGDGQFRTSATPPSDQDLDGAIFGGIWTKQIDITANFDNTEQDTGWDIPANAVILNVFLRVSTADAGETLDVGTDGGSNDPDGFLDGVSVNATGVVKGTLDSGGQTLGALLRADTTGASVFVPEPDVSSGGSSVTYTGSANPNTMRGSIFIIYTILNA